MCQTSPLATSAFDTLSFTPTGGIGNFTFQWYVNGNQINGAIDTFYIPPSNDTGIFQYHCVVQQLPEEIDCWVSTDTCTLIVTDGPSVETPDQDTTICVDGTIDPLTVNPGPNGGQPNYQWYVNGTIITTNGNDSTYQVPTNIAGTYIYECELTFPIGGCDSVTSDPITIEIVADPIIATQPQLIDTICENNQPDTCLYINYDINTGVGQDSYQWYYSTTNSYNGTPISSAIYDTFTPITDTLNIGSHYYYVILSFEGNGCTNDTSQIAQIEIIGDPQAEFDLWSNLNSDSLCVNHSQTPVWINESTGTNINTFIWEIVDNSSIPPNTIYTFTTNDSIAPAFPFLPSGDTINGYINYDLILTVSNGCSSPSDNHTLTIIPLPNPEFVTLVGIDTSTTVCLNSPITVSVGNSEINPPFVSNEIYNDQIIIDFGDGTTIIINDSCGIGGSNLTCFESINHIYNSVGIYTITVTAINECDTVSDSTIIEVINTNIVSSVQNAIPFACVGDEVIFNDNSSNTAPSETYIYWWWNVDPNIDISDYLKPNGFITHDEIVYQDTATPSYDISNIYSTPGIKYVLQQMVTGPIPPCLYEYDESFIDSIIIYPKPIANFINPIGDDACLLDSVLFQYNSEIPIVTGIPSNQQNIIEVTWEVEAPDQTITSYTLTNINDDLKILVDQSGIWKITINILTNTGCSNQWTDSITVYDLPQPAFSLIPDSTCAGGGSSQFNGWPSTHNPPGPSIETDNPIVYWSWNFDNPSGANNIILNSTVGDAIHQYSNSGSYDVTLTVTDDEGCKATYEDSIYISTPIEARAIAYSSCFGTPTFIDGSISTFGTTSWCWDFDMDGICDPGATGDTISYIFPNAGLNTFRLIIESNSIADSVICTDDTVMSVWIYSLPEAVLTSDTVCYKSGDSTSFNNIIIEGDTTLNYWFLDFGDNQFTSDSTINHLYDTCGNYEAILSIADNYNCQNKDTFIVTVACPPIANIYSDVACLGNPTYFCADSSIGGTFNITNWSWSNIDSGNWIPGNGNFDCIYYEFDDAGLHNATTLIITDQHGCSDTTTNNANVRLNPIANFGTVDTNYCAEQPIQFYDSTLTFNSNPNVTLDSIIGFSKQEYLLQLT